MSSRRKLNDPPPIVSTIITRSLSRQPTGNPPAASSSASKPTTPKPRGSPKKSSESTPRPSAAKPRAKSAGRGRINSSEASGPTMLTPEVPESSTPRGPGRRGQASKHLEATEDIATSSNQRSQSNPSEKPASEDSGPVSGVPTTPRGCKTASKVPEGPRGLAPEVGSTQNAAEPAAEVPELAKPSGRRGRAPKKQVAAAPEAIEASESAPATPTTPRDRKNASKLAESQSGHPEVSPAVAASSVATSSALTASEAVMTTQNVAELVPDVPVLSKPPGRRGRAPKPVPMAPEASEASQSAPGVLTTSPAATSAALPTTEAVTATQNASELAPHILTPPKPLGRRGRAPKPVRAAPGSAPGATSMAPAAPVTPEAPATPNTPRGRKNASKSAESQSGHAEFAQAVAASSATMSSAVTDREAVTATQNAAESAPPTPALPKPRGRRGRAPKSVPMAPESAPEAAPIPTDAPSTPNTLNGRQNESKLVESSSGSPESAPIIAISSAATPSALTAPEAVETPQNALESASEAPKLPKLSGTRGRAPKQAPVAPNHFKAPENQTTSSSPTSSALTASEGATSTEKDSEIPGRRGRAPKQIPATPESSETVPDALTTSTKRTTPGRRAASLRAPYSSSNLRNPQIRAMSSLRVMMLATEDMTMRVPESSSSVKKSGRAEKESGKANTSSKRRRVHFSDDDEEEEGEEPGSISSAADDNLEAEQLTDSQPAPGPSTRSRSIPMPSAIVVAPVSESASSAAPEPPRAPNTPLDNNTKPRGKAATPHPKAVKASDSLTSFFKAKKYPCPFTYCKQRPYTRERDLELHLKKYHSYEMESVEISGSASEANSEDVMAEEPMNFNAPSLSTAPLGAQKRKTHVPSKTAVAAPPPPKRRRKAGPGRVPEEVVELTEVFGTPETNSEGVRIEKENEREVNLGQSAYEIFPFVYEPREEPPEFIFSVGEMARKIILQLHQKIRFAPRAQTNGTYCIACLEYRSQSGTCHRRHDSNDDRIQKFWSSEFQRDPKTLSREVIMEDLEEICTKWE